MAAPVIECESAEQVKAVCELLEQMYDDQPAERIHQLVPQMQQEGWKLIGIFDAQGQCDATIQYMTGTRLFCGKYMQVESLFIRPEKRRQGYAEALFQWLEDKAKADKCDRVFLHSFVENFNGHRFFYSQGYYTRGFVLNKLLTDTYQR